MAIDPNPDLVESLQKQFASNGEIGVYAYASGWMSAMIVPLRRGTASTALAAKLAVTWVNSCRELRRSRSSTHLR